MSVFRGKISGLIVMKGVDMDEIWKTIPGFDGDYEASSLGRVRSFKRSRTNPYLLSRWTQPNGYIYTMLCMHGVYQTRGVHRLTLSAFAGPPPDDSYHACHIDGDRTNNVPENLYWGTPKENAGDMRRHNRHRNGRRTHCQRGHEFSDENTLIRKNGTRLCLSCKRITENAAYHRRQATKRAS